MVCLSSGTSPAISPVHIHQAPLLRAGIRVTVPILRQFIARVLRNSSFDMNLALRRHGFFVISFVSFKTRLALQDGRSSISLTVVEDPTMYSLATGRIQLSFVVIGHAVG